MNFEFISKLPCLVSTWQNKGRLDGYAFICIFVNLKEFFQKVNNWLNQGWFTKLILLIVVTTIAFYPFFSAQSKLKKALGDQPKMMAGIYISIFVMLFIIVFTLVKTRPKNQDK